MVRLTPDRGAQITGKIAAVLADTHARARAAVTPAEQAVKHAAVEALMEKWERTLSGVNRDLLTSLFSGDGPDGKLAGHIESITSTDHQVDFIVNVGAAVMSVFSIAGAIVAGGIDELTALSREREPHVPLSPQAAAQAVVNNIWDQGQGEREALRSGMTPQLFEVLMRITGQPLAPQVLMEAYRRGIINEGRMHEGLLQGDTRNEWFDVMVALRYQPMSPAAAIAAAVQGHLNIEEAKRKAAEAGLDPADWEPLYETAGNPPGNETMLNLLNRGDMSEADVRQGLRESNLKNKYIDAFVKSRRRLMPQENVRMALRRGTMSLPDALHRLQQLGYDAADAAALAALASDEKTETDKQLARTQVVDGYMERFFDRNRAVTLLEGLGYDREEAAFLLDLADHAREERFRTAAVGRFHTLYVRRRVDRSATSNALDRLGVPPGQRDDLLKLWDLEREADVPDLTVAQYQGLLRRGVIDQDRFAAEMQRRGYTDEEATFLIPLAFPPSQFG